MKPGIIFLLSMTVLISSSCKKDHETDFNMQNFFQCNNSLQLDTNGITSRLTGSWNLVSWQCGFCLNPGWHYPDKKVVVTFTESKTFSVMENALIVGQGNFSFIRIDNNWGIQTSNFSSYTNGIILFCNNQLLLSDSYRDGADNLFYKGN